MRKAPAIAGLVTVCSLLAFALTQPFVMAQPSQPPAVDAARLEAHVRTLCGRFFPRSFDSNKLNEAADYVKAELQRSGARVQEQVYEVEGEKYRNIVARFGPSQGRLIVVGAHYDTESVPSEHPTPQTHTPGADDNASGVAGLLELARLLGEHPPAVPVELVAYTLEEPPHYGTQAMGSAVHAHRLRQSGEPVALMISLEMIGYFSDLPNSQRYPVAAMRALYGDRGNFISIVGRVQDWAPTRHLKAALRGASNLRVESINAVAAIPGIDFSDHRNYWAEGFPAVMITDTSFYRNTAYHTAQDTPDRLNYTNMAKVVQGVFQGIQSYTP